MNPIPSLQSLSERLEEATWHGRYIRAKCPFHEDTSPSLLVFEDMAICMAASCGRRIPLPALARKIEGRPLAQPILPTNFMAWKNIPDLESLVAEAHAFLLAYPEQKTYLAKRGLSERIEPQQLGWWAGWYVVPFFDEKGRLTGVVLRAGPVLSVPEKDRFRIPPGQAPCLYSPDWPLVRRSPYLILVFGVFDALTLCELRLPVATVVPARTLRPDLLENFRKTIWIVPDRGEEELGQQWIASLGWRGRLRALNYPPGTKDPNGFFEVGKKEFLRRGLALG